MSSAPLCLRATAVRSPGRWSEDLLLAEKGAVAQGMDRLEVHANVLSRPSGLGSDSMAAGRDPQCDRPLPQGLPPHTAGTKGSQVRTQTALPCLRRGEKRTWARPGDWVSTM